MPDKTKPQPDQSSARQMLSALWPVANLMGVFIYGALALIFVGLFAMQHGKELAQILAIAAMGAAWVAQNLHVTNKGPVAQWFAFASAGAAIASLAAALMEI